MGIFQKLDAEAAKLIQREAHSAAQPATRHPTILPEDAEAQ
jgi:hypothetical protein